jgi:DNA-directed RNA polymerase specialized sigma24 family protein
MRKSFRAKSLATNETPAPQGSRLADLVDRIRRGHPTGFEELYGMAKNFSFFLLRQLGHDDLQDKVHDVFVTTAQAIVAGKLRDPERLVPFVTTVTRFYTYGQIDRRTRWRKLEGSLEHVNVPDARINLEQTAYCKQKAQIVWEILGVLKPRDSELLRRFYLQEQTKEEICREMKLTPTQFRLLKSRAKSRFTALGLTRVRDGRIALSELSPDQDAALAAPRTAA